MTRRRFVGQLGRGFSGAALCAVPFDLPSASPRKRRVVVMSDLHIGRMSDGHDGGEWLSRGIEDLRRHVRPVQYGLTLGDITHRGDRASLERYLELRDRSAVPRWFELAGNHEFRGRGIQHYRELVRDISPYRIVDGNLLWILLSDERKRASGNISTGSRRWLEETVHRHRDMIIIVCSHQPPPDTVRRSEEDMFCLHPRKEMKDLLSRLPIALSLCGHEHHRPYSKDNISELNGTTVINVASMTHAYGTTSSESIVLEFEENSREAVVRRRSHDQGVFIEKFEIRVPLERRVRLASRISAC